ncbi:MAG: hypothetical protein ACOVP4_14110 [Bacteriovoracaceae bacterium]
MKKIWWLNLYTIPSLIVLLKWGGIILLVDIAYSQVIADLLGLEKEIGVVVYPSFICSIILQSAKTNLAQHLHFHKTHISNQVLNKALLSDASLFSIGALLIFYSNLWLSSVLGGSMSDSTSYLSSLVFHAPSILIIFFSFVFCLLFVSRINDAEIAKSYYASLKGWKKLKNSILSLIIYSIFTSIIVIPLVLVEGLGLNLVFIVAGFASCIIMIHDRRSALLHLRKIDQPFKYKIKYAIPSLLFSIVFVYFVSFLSHLDLSSKKISPEAKMTVVSTWSVFAPEINLKTFQEIAPHSNLLNASVLYSKAQKNIDGVPVEMLLTDLNPESILLHFIYGKSVERDYRFISEQILQNIDEWKNSSNTGEIISLVHKKCKTCWVSDFDKQLISEKLNYKWPKNLTIDRREIASDPAKAEEID